jgi:hypothetical protein
MERGIAVCVPILFSFDNSLPYCSCVASADQAQFFLRQPSRGRCAAAARTFDISAGVGMSIPTSGLPLRPLRTESFDPDRANGL